MGISMLEEITAPLLSTDWGRRGIIAALIIFSLLLVMTLIKMPLTWHNDYVLAHTQPAAKAAPLSTSSTTMLMMQIPDHHLFGAGQTDHLPVTSLELRLVGIVQAEPESASRVIISESGRPGKIYQAGDSLLSGIRIKTVLSDGVILENGGRMEKLPLSRPPLTFQGKPRNLLSGE
jgi:type II secretory pathway component PulC